ENHLTRRQGFQQRRVRQEDLIDEVDIFHSLRDETVEFFENHRQRTLAIAIAEVVLGTKRTMVRTATGGLDFRTRPPGRRVEAVVVVLMAQYYVSWPLQGGQRCHIRGVRSTLHAHLTLVSICQRRDAAPLLTR